MPGAEINVNAGSINLGGSLFARIEGSTSIFGTAEISATTNITVGDDIDLSTGTARLIAGGNISAGHDLSVYDFLSAGGSITAASLFSHDVSAGSDITINGGRLLVDSLTAGGALRLNNVQQFIPQTKSSSSSVAGTPLPFDLSVGSIVSTGPAIPVLDHNGNDAFSTTGGPGNGGNLAIQVRSAGLTIGAGNDLAGITANGGQFRTASTGGNGGTIDISTFGDFALLNGSISATSGLVPSDANSAPKGSGGTVNINAQGAITVGSKIEVSSADPPAPTPPPAPPRRRSRQGGNINMTSSKAGAPAARQVAINISDSGQLLSLLEAAAPGPGGRITIRATGANSDLNVKGRVQADRGTVDIRHTANGGNVNLGGVGNSALAMRGDVVKVATLGDGGVLSIGGGIISANTTLQLYSVGFNGEVRFVSNVSLSGSGAKHIAGNAVTINQDVVVTIMGPAANIYVNSTAGEPNANYSRDSGGNGNTNGRFTRGDSLDAPAVGAPQPLNNRPALDSPGG